MRAEDQTRLRSPCWSRPAPGPRLTGPGSACVWLMASLPGRHRQTPAEQTDRCQSTCQSTSQTTISTSRVQQTLVLLFHGMLVRPQGCWCCFGSEGTGNHLSTTVQFGLVGSCTVTSHYLTTNQNGSDWFGSQFIPGSYFEEFPVHSGARITQTPVRSLSEEFYSISVTSGSNRSL